VIGLRGFGGFEPERLIVVAEPAGFSRADGLGDPGIEGFRAEVIVEGDPGPLDDVFGEESGDEWAGSATGGGAALNAEA